MLYLQDVMLSTVHGCTAGDPLQGDKRPNTSYACIPTRVVSPELTRVINTEGMHA